MCSFRTRRSLWACSLVVGGRGGACSRGWSPCRSRRRWPGVALTLRSTSSPRDKPLSDSGVGCEPGSYKQGSHNLTVRLGPLPTRLAHRRPAEPLGARYLPDEIGLGDRTRTWSVPARPGRACLAKTFPRAASRCRSPGPLGSAGGNAAMPAKAERAEPADERGSGRLGRIPFGRTRDGGVVGKPGARADHRGPLFFWLFGREPAPSRARSFVAVPLARRGPAPPPRYGRGRSAKLPALD